MSVAVVVERAADPPGDVEVRLRARGVSTCVLDLDALAHSAVALQFTIGPDAGPRITWRDARTALPVHSDDVAAVWLHGDGASLVPVPVEERPDDDVVQRAARERLREAAAWDAWMCARHALDALCAGRLCLPGASVRMHGRSFGLQQRVARRAGFLLPPTVVGSVFEERLAVAAADPASHPTRGSARSSSVAAGSALHYAPLVPASFIAQGERHVSVDRWLDGVPRFAFARVPPAIFSLRPMQGVRTLVAVIGEQTFAAHCTTREPDDDPDVTHLAWHAAWDNLDVTPVAPSSSLIDAARRFARGMQLGCVVIDVLSTNDGDHFLRADPQAGLTILQDAGIPVVDEIVTHLTGAGAGELR